MSHSSTTINSYILEEPHKGKPIFSEKNFCQMKLTACIADYIISLIDYEIPEDEDPTDDSVFSSSAYNDMTIQEILENFSEDCEINDTSLLLMLILLDRFSKRSSIRLNIYNIHKILFSALICATKYNEDIICDNEYYSKVARLPLGDLNTLEFSFIHQISYKIHVTEREFSEFKEKFTKFCTEPKPCSDLFY